MKAISGDTLGVDPFRLLADEVPGARENMGNHTLVVVGAHDGSGQPSFFVLDHVTNPRLHDEANGGELLDSDVGCWCEESPPERSRKMPRRLVEAPAPNNARFVCGQPVEIPPPSTQFIEVAWAEK